MKVTDIIRELMQVRDVKPSVLAARLGIKNNVLSERLTQKNMSINKLNEMLRVLDYKVVILPRDKRVPEDGYEVE